MLFYRAAVDLSRPTLNYVAGIIRRHRKAIGSVWRRLNPAQQGLLVLIYLPKGETYNELVSGFGVSVATAWRYVEETVALLRARALKLDRALRNAAREGLQYLAQAGMLTLADKGYQGAEGPVATPYKGRNKPLSQKAANRSHARLRGPGERANAQLKGWRILRKLRCCPHKAGQLCKAIAVLQNYELTHE